MSEWLAVEAIVRQRDKEKTAHAVAKLSSESASGDKTKGIDVDADMENDVFEDNDFSDISDPGDFENEKNIEEKTNEETTPIKKKPSRINKSSTDSGNVPDEEIKIDEDGLDEESIKYNKDTIQLSNDDDDGDKDEKMNIENMKDEKLIKIDNIELISPSLDGGMVLELKENCFGDNNLGGKDLLMSTKSSPSTSSYETVGNEFIDLSGNNITEHLKDMKIPEFQSVDDIQMELTEIEDDSEKTQKLQEDDQQEEEEETPTSSSHHASVIVTKASIDIANMDNKEDGDGSNTNDENYEKKIPMTPVQEELQNVLDALQEPKSACVSPASSNGGIYSVRIFFFFFFK